MTLAIRFVIFGMVGFVMEVIWTGLGSLVEGNLKASSRTSLWMFFIYGSAAFMTPLILMVYPMHWIFRGLIYAFGIFIVEYTAGIILKKADICPWDYSQAKLNIHGVIRLDYAPVWVAVGLFLEFIHMSFFI
jgi:uncharacterized membrane protein